MSKPRLQLVGSNGNAFYVLGKAIQVGRKFGWGKEKTDEFLIEARGGDFNHLLQTCMNYFDVV